MDLLNQVTNIYQESLTENSELLQQLTERGINAETIQTFEMGFSSSYCLSSLKQGNQERLLSLGLLNQRGNERNWNRLMFPIRNEKNIICGFNGRSLDEAMPKYLLSPERMGFKKTKLLYNLDRAKKYIEKENQVYIVEGVMDVISLWQGGVKNVVCSLGTTLTIDQIKLLEPYTEKFTFAYDSDFAGFKASILNSRALAQWMKNQNKETIPNHYISFLNFPKGSDPGDYLKKPKELEKILSQPLTYMEHCKLNCEQNRDYLKVFEELEKRGNQKSERRRASYLEDCTLLSQIDLVEVVSDYLPLTKNGNNYKGLCPFHSEKTPSFTVSCNKQICKCFGCGVGGNAITFIAKIENVSEQEAIKILKDKYQLKEQAMEKRQKKIKTAQVNEK